MLVCSAKKPTKQTKTNHQTKNSNVGFYSSPHSTRANKQTNTTGIPYITSNPASRHSLSHHQVPTGQAGREPALPSPTPTPPTSLRPRPPRQPPHSDTASPRQTAAARTRFSQAARPAPPLPRALRETAPSLQREPPTHTHPTPTSRAPKDPYQPFPGSRRASGRDTRPRFTSGRAPAPAVGRRKAGSHHARAPPGEGGRLPPPTWKGKGRRMRAERTGACCAHVTALTSSPAEPRPLRRGRAGRRGARPGRERPRMEAAAI